MVQVVLEVQENNMTVEEQTMTISRMTLRDYFAGQALAGMGQYLMENRDDLDSIAKTCYNIADSFIEQRVK